MVYAVCGSRVKCEERFGVCIVYGVCSDERNIWICVEVTLYVDKCMRGLRYLCVICF
jgi:hypothetical protein